MIIDGHAHVLAADYGSVEVLLRQLDEAGIDRVLCVPGGMVDVRQMSRVALGTFRPNPNIPNHLVYDALDGHGGRVYGFVCINPRAGAAALGMMEDGFRHGCRGVKLAPNVHQFGFGEPVLMDVAAACGGRGFPVYTHVLPQPGSTTADFAAESANLYLETSLGNYLIMRDALDRLGPGKLIFGSEFPLGHPRAELENVRLLDPSAHEAILAGNILRLLGVTS